MNDRFLEVYRTHDPAVLDTALADVRYFAEYRTPSQTVDHSLNTGAQRYLGILQYDPEYGGLGVITGQVMDDSSAGPYTVRLYTYDSSVLVRSVLTTSEGLFLLVGLRTDFEWLVVGYSNNISDAYDPATDRIYLTDPHDTTLVIPGNNDGLFQIKGTVTELGIAGSYLVRLFDRQSARCIGETWSSAEDGSYLFDNIAYLLNGYFAIAFDHGDNPLNAAIADLITPEPMP